METAFPALINVEIMTVCNLRCSHCKVQFYSKTKHTPFMPLNKFERFLDRLHSLVQHASEFMFSSVEPLLHPHLFEMMDVIAGINPEMSFPIQTNGMLLTRQAVEALCLRNVPWISIALDGCDPVTAQTLKVGSDFQRVVDNIKLLKTAASRPIRLRSVFVVQRKNIAQLTDYVEFCHELGIDEIDVNGLFTFSREQGDLILYSPQGNEYALQKFREAKAKATAVGIEIQFPRLTPTPLGCDSTSNFNVDEEGNVSPCVLLAKSFPFYFLGRQVMNAALSFGNIFEKEPLEIWRDHRFASFRQSLRFSRLPSSCASCSEGYGVICSKRILIPEA